MQYIIKLWLVILIWNIYSFSSLGDDDNSTKKNCSGSDSEDDFPTFFLNDDQIRKGGIVVCIIIGIYGFTLLACVCDGYFLPCVETICELLHLTPVSGHYRIKE